MKFEDLQSLWDCQDSKSQSSLDPHAVLASIRKRSHKLGLEVNLYELMLFWMLILVGLLDLKDPVFQGHDLHQIIPSVLCLGAAAGIWKGRWHRKLAEVSFDDSLLGVVEKSIAQHRYKVTQMRRYIWYCIVPLSVSIVLSYFYAKPEKGIWFLLIFFPLFVFMMALSYFVMRWEVNRCSRPQLAELETLRAKLLEVEHLDS